MPMQIDFVITELFVGGAEKCLTEVALAMAAVGDDVRVFSLGSLPQGEQRILVDRLRQAGLGVESAEADSVWSYRRVFRFLCDQFRQRPPELVQTFLHHANVVGIRAAAAAGVPVRVGGIRVAQPKPIRSLVERMALRRAQSVICVSSAVERFAQSVLGCPKPTTIVIPNGVDVEHYQSANPIPWSTLGWPDQSQVCLFLGRLHPQKGIELLQSQINRIAPAHSRCKLLLVGDGPLRPSLETWCGQVGADRVQCLPWQAEVAPWIRGCRLMVLPSRYEGMPNVLLEAMAAAKPVVCSRVEGSEELLGADPDSQGFPPGDARQMANRIEQFQSDEQLCREVGRSNQQRIRTHFSLGAMTDAYRHHYLNLLARRLDET
jgi:glycosyltransferase involved in cell wall biosynthesis